MIVLIIALIISLLGLLVLTIFFKKTITQYSSEKLELSSKLIKYSTENANLTFQLASAEAQVSLLKVISSSAVMQNNIDDKSKKLIILAVNTSNEHEARTAAFSACKRIAKTI